MANPALSVLRRAVKGLLYMSEKDAPFKIMLKKQPAAHPRRCANLSN